MGIDTFHGGSLFLDFPAGFQERTCGNESDKKRTEDN